MNLTLFHEILQKYRNFFRSATFVAESALFGVFVRGAYNPSARMTQVGGEMSVLREVSRVSDIPKRVYVITNKCSSWINPFHVFQIAGSTCFLPKGPDIFSHP
jgi:hypothetical protein